MVQMSGLLCKNLAIVLSGLIFCFAQSVISQELFNYNLIKSNACELAKKPFVPDEPLPKNLALLGYDDLRNIRFNPKEAIWRRERLPFQLQFFHPGGIQKHCVKVNLVEGEIVEPVNFNRDLFEYYNVKIKGSIPDNIGFSGFRVHYPLNRPDYLDELIVFQGATYFRALGRGQRYGISARALCINVAAEEDEIFPAFKEFWIEKPDRTSSHIKIYAIFDCSNVVGACEFAIFPGDSTVMNVNIALYPRTATTNFGIAPLTSMFWYGEADQNHYGDYRPEVHDSDGLLFWTGAGEWVWRPLVNGKKLRYASFVDNGIRGFGLMQRDRKFTSYEDLEAFYHLRPSLWIEPKTNWGEGWLRLVEFPTTVEYADNIVAFWQPRQPMFPGEVREYSYRMRWMGEDPSLPPLGRVISTRMADISYNQKAKRFILDFGGHELTDDAKFEEVVADVSAINGKILGKFMHRNEYVRGVRVFFDAEPENPALPMELRCFIKDATKPLSETWSYQWTP